MWVHKYITTYNYIKTACLGFFMPQREAQRPATMIYVETHQDRDFLITRVLKPSPKVKVSRRPTKCI